MHIFFKDLFYLYMFINKLDQHNKKIILSGNRDKAGRYFNKYIYILKEL